MEFDLKTIGYVLGGIVAGIGALAAFAIKNPEAHAKIVDRRLSKVIGLLAAWSFGALLLGFYVLHALIPLTDPARQKEVTAATNAMWLFAISGHLLSIVLFAVQIWLHGIASDSEELKQPVQTKE